MTTKTYENDYEWWMREARNDPDTASEIIETLSQRLIVLQEINESLRAENIKLRQGKKSTDSYSPDSFENTIARLKGYLEVQNVNIRTFSLVTSKGFAVQVPHNLFTKKTGSNKDGVILDLPDCNDADHYILGSARISDLFLVITSSTQVLSIEGIEIPVYGNSNPSIKTNLLSELTDNIAVVKPMPSFARLVLITQEGFVRKFLKGDLEDSLSKKKPLLIDFGANDSPIKLLDARGDILIATRNGKFLKIHPKDISSQGEWLTLGKMDKVVDATTVNYSDSVYFVSVTGHIMAIASDAFPNSKRLDIGLKTLPTLPGEILACFACRHAPAIAWFSKDKKFGIVTLESIMVAKDLRFVAPTRVIKHSLKSITSFTRIELQEK